MGFLNASIDSNQQINFPQTAGVMSGLNMPQSQNLPAAMYQSPVMAGSVSLNPGSFGSADLSSLDALFRKLKLSRDNPALTPVTRTTAPAPVRTSSSSSSTNSYTTGTNSQQIMQSQAPSYTVQQQPVYAQVPQRAQQATVGGAVGAAGYGTQGGGRILSDDEFKRQLAQFMPQWNTANAQARMAELQRNGQARGWEYQMLADSLRPGWNVPQGQVAMSAGNQHVNQLMQYAAQGVRPNADLLATAQYYDDVWNQGGPVTKLPMITSGGQDWSGGGGSGPEQMGPANMFEGAPVVGEGSRYQAEQRAQQDARWAASNPQGLTGAGGNRPDGPYGNGSYNWETAPGYQHKQLARPVNYTDPEKQYNKQVYQPSQAYTHDYQDKGVYYYPREQAPPADEQVGTWEYGQKYGHRYGTEFPAWHMPGWQEAQMAPEWDDGDGMEQSTPPRGTAPYRTPPQEEKNIPLVWNDPDRMDITRGLNSTGQPAPPMVATPDMSPWAHLGEWGSGPAVPGYNLPADGMAQNTPRGPLTRQNDGYVPYTSGSADPFRYTGNQQAPGMGEQDTRYNNGYRVDEYHDISHYMGPIPEFQLGLGHGGGGTGYTRDPKAPVYKNGKEVPSMYSGAPAAADNSHAWLGGEHTLGTVQTPWGEMPIGSYDYNLPQLARTIFGQGVDNLFGTHFAPQGNAVSLAQYQAMMNKAPAQGNGSDWFRFMQSAQAKGKR